MAYFAPKRFTASGLVSNDPCLIGGMFLQAGSDAATAEIANQTTGSGAAAIKCVGASANAVDRAQLPTSGVHLSAGAYITLTGTDPEAIVYIARASGGNVG